MGNQNCVWPDLEEIRKNVVGCTSLLGCLASQNALQAVYLLATLFPKLFNLQLMVGEWPKMGENKNTNAVLTLFSESY